MSASTIPSETSRMVDVVSMGLLQLNVWWADAVSFWVAATAAKANP